MKRLFAKPDPALATPRHQLAISPRVGLFALAFAVFGAGVILLSHAAVTGAYEAESAQLSGPAVLAAQTLASGGKMVVFGATTATPTPVITPTPAPTTAPTVTAAPGSSACAAYPAFPDVTCTGVPAGYKLTSVANLSSSANGQVIDGQLVAGDITINHNNVTISNTRVKGRINNNGHSGLTLSHVDVGPDACPTASDSSWFAIDPNSVGFTFKNVHAHNLPNDIIRLAGNGAPILIQDSLINQTCYYAGDHLDTIQWYDPGSFGTVNLVHSNIDVRPVNSTDKGNSAVFWADGAAAGTTLTMYNNRFAGGQITTALYDATKGSGIVINVHDNVYVNNSWAGGPCSFGSSKKSIVFDGTSGVKFTNNTLDTGGAVICN